MRIRTRKDAIAVMVASIVAACAVFCASLAEAAYLRDVPQVLIQPDGTRIECFASGDEFYHWLHDADGFVIVRDPETGYWVWADKKDGDLAPTEHVVGRIPPRLLDIEPRILPDRSFLKSERMELFSSPPAEPAPSTGSMENLVIFIRFGDEAEFTAPLSGYETDFNSTSGGSSMKAYFTEVSYNQLTINSTFYPTPGSTVVSYQDAHFRAYYQPYDETTNPAGYASATEKRVREHTLLKNAVDAVSSQVPGTLNIDADGDGRVDNVVFVIQGSPDGWSNLLWPHRWALYTLTANINGKRVWDYNFQLNDALEVGVLCHEMFHTLGAPDLYHYYTETDVLPAGKWDLMNWNTDPPQHMTSYMKMKYGGWITSIPEITTNGTYTLNPVTSSTNNAYKIASPFTTGEYFVVEYRRKTGTFESSVPGSGLIVYRIDEIDEDAEPPVPIEGNAAGPPDELYIYRPGGSNTENGNHDEAHLNFDVGRTEINDTTDPSSFLSDDSNGGLDISDVTAAGETISFTVSVEVGDDFGISVSPSSREICRGSTADFEVAVSQFGSFTGDVALSSSGKPIGSSTGFSTNPVTTPGTSTYTVSNTVNAEIGTSTIQITGTGDTGTRGDSVDLTIITTPGVSTLLNPYNTAANVPGTPTFTWTSASGATSYSIQIDQDPNFGSIDHIATVQTTSYSGATLDLDTTYHWRVVALNSCGSGSYSTVSSFSTIDGSTECTNVLVEPGFEGGPGSAWSEYSSNEFTLITTDVPHTGSYSAWLGGWNLETSQVWQAAAIDAQASSAALRYWYGITSNEDSCGDDVGELLINGTPADEHIYDLCTSANIGIWLQSSPVDLLSLAGTAPEIRFNVTTDGSQESSLFVDDVTLEVCVSSSQPATIFVDDFEFGNTDQWSTTVPTLPE